jgi:hypothetical protein
MSANDLKSKEPPGDEIMVSRKIWFAVGYVTSLETDNEEKRHKRNVEISIGAIEILSPERFQSSHSWD